MKIPKKKKLTIIVTIAAVLCVIELIVLGFNCIGPLNVLSSVGILQKYNAADCQNQIVFYGASNFARWETMEQDLPGYKVQNHGFGGSTDQDLYNYAGFLLYNYKPLVVVFQTGSNDYVASSGTKEEILTKCMDFKQKMFEKFHTELPDAKFIVMSGLLLPGRSQYLDLTKEVNSQLKELCAKNSDYMYFVDASDLSYDGKSFNNGLFVEDGIHLNHQGQTEWANKYIIPALDTAVSDLGDKGKTLRK